MSPTQAHLNIFPPLFVDLILFINVSSPPWFDMLLNLIHRLNGDVGNLGSTNIRGLSQGSTPSQSLLAKVLVVFLYLSAHSGVVPLRQLLQSGVEPEQEEIQCEPKIQ